MPSYKRTSMRFIRDILRGQKRLLKCSEVHPINVPYFPELAVDRVFNEVKADPELLSFYNIYEDRPEVPERTYFYSVLGTLRRQYLEDLIHSQNL